MNHFSFTLVVFVAIFKNPSTVTAADIPVDKVDDITIFVDSTDGKMISGVDVRNKTYGTDFYRGNWCLHVNPQLSEKLGIDNRVHEKETPGRGWIYEIHIGNASELVYGFVCVATPTPFLVVMTQDNPDDFRFRAYVPLTGPTIKDRGTQGGPLHGVYDLRSVAS